MAKSKTYRKPVSDAVRQKGITARTQRGIFNQYIRSLNGRTAQKNRQKMLDIEEALARGTRIKVVAKFAEGKRVGSEEKELPLLPSEMATLLAQKARLEKSFETSVSREQREQFLSILPDFATRNDFTYEILIAVGVPKHDLVEAGILPGD